ncbi:MAG TPA: hypothetical protein DD426_00035 [Clostridiaceae bacterium]|nr:hypothetical protein [Clostridiaceae bacterium]
MAAKSIKELIEVYESSRVEIQSSKIIFSGMDEMDVYNITAPFKDMYKEVLAGRVEKRESEDSRTVFFVNKENRWIPKENMTNFRLQDPFITKIKGELIFGGVETYPHPYIKNALGYKTVFYRGSSTDRLHKFTEGPGMMKDIRLIEFPEGEIGIFTRPQGKIGGRGKIGFTKIKSLDELNADIISSAKLIEDQFIDEEWGGSNELHILNNGLVGVLGHIARFDEKGYRHYYSMVFSFDPKTCKASDIRIILMRSELPEGNAKRSDLKDVLFSGGIIRLNNGKAELYVGVSDAEAYKVTIEDPFKIYEK